MNTLIILALIIIVVLIVMLLYYDPMIDIIGKKKHRTIIIWYNKWSKYHNKFVVDRAYKILYTEDK